MGYWGGIAAAALLWALTGIAQHRALEAIPHEAVELAPGIPATIYRPPVATRSPDPLPTVVLAHGWGANRGSLRVLARELAAAGYAAISVDLAGHGASGRAFPASSGAVGALLTDVDAAVLYARGHAEFDGERLALLGHGLGGDLVLEYASRNPGSAAVIALAPARAWSGSYTPANALLIWGEEQRLRSPAVARTLGERLVGTPQIRVGHSYGNVERGSGVRTVELESSGYYDLLFSESATREIRDWLATTLSARPAPDAPAGSVGAEPQPAPPPSLLRWGLLGLAASAALFWFACGVAAPVVGLAVGSAELAPPAPLWALGRYAGALAAALLVAGAGDRAELRGPFEFFPFAGAAPLLGVLLVLGALLALAAARDGSWRRPPAAVLLTALGLAGLLYATAGSAIAPAFDPWLDAGRTGWALVAAVLALPACALSEQLLRGRGAARLLPALAKLLLLLGLVAAGALGWLGSDWLQLWPWLAALLLALELASLRLQAVAPGGWLAGGVQALALGWFLVAAFPQRF